MHHRGKSDKTLDEHTLHHRVRSDKAPSGKRWIIRQKNIKQHLKKDEGEERPTFQQVYSPPFIFVRKSFQDANNDSSQPLSAHPLLFRRVMEVINDYQPPSFSSHPLLEERTFWSAIYDIPPLFSAHPLLFRRVMEVINDYQPPSLSSHPLLRLPKVKSKDFPRKVYIPL